MFYTGGIGINFTRQLNQAGLMGKLLRERKAQMPTYKKGNELGAPEGSSVPWPDQVKGNGF